MAERRDDATQDPTAQRLRRAEQSGQFARSRELATAITWLGGIALLVTFGGNLWNSMQHMAATNWKGSNVATNANELFREQLATGNSIFWSVLIPILGGVAAIALLAHFGQSGFRFLPHLAIPDPARISPRQNLARLFRIEQTITVCLGLVKLVVMMLIAGWVLLGDLPTLMELGHGTVRQSSQATADWLISATMRMLIASAIIGVADYGIRWQLNRRSLRMTDQEIRDEQRSMEPSSEVNARRRLMQGR